MKKNIVRLTESQLHKVIKESVARVLKEEGMFDPYDEDSKEFQNDRSWRDLEGGWLEDDAIGGANPKYMRDSEYRFFQGKPTQPNGMVDIYGVAPHENWNVHDTKGQASMHSMSKNPYVRHQFKNMRDSLHNSVENGWNTFKADDEI